MGVMVGNDSFETEEEPMIKVIELWTFKIHGKQYQITEYQKADATFPVWDDYFIIELDGKVLERRFTSLIAALLFILGDASDK